MKPGWAVFWCAVGIAVGAGGMYGVFRARAGGPSEAVIRQEVLVQAAEKEVQIQWDTVQVYESRAEEVLVRYEDTPTPEPISEAAQKHLDSLVAKVENDRLRMMLEVAVAVERKEHERVAEGLRLKLSLADSAVYRALDFASELEGLVAAQQVQIEQLEGLVAAHKGEWWKRAGFSLGTYAVARGIEKLVAKR